MTPAEIIALAGGVIAVSARLGVAVKTVSNNRAMRVCVLRHDQKASGSKRIDAASRPHHNSTSGRWRKPHANADQEHGRFP